MADGEALRFFFRMLVRRGIAAAAVLLGFWGATAHAQMSPGDLSQAHKDLEGPLKCVSCHASGAGAEQLKCLDCHEEIRRRLGEASADEVDALLMEQLELRKRLDALSRPAA